MPFAITPRRSLAALPIVLSVAALAGCGGNSDTPSTGIAVPAAAAAVQRQFTDVVAKVSPQVVQIQTPQGLGSGIVFDRNGDIVTNAHVTGTSDRFVVTLSDGSRHPAALVGADPGNDLAVIRASGHMPAPASFAQTGTSAGQIVFAIGNPLGLQSSVTQGIVSSVNRKVGEGNGVTLSDAIQTSAEINPGNSGGALVNLKGQVIGVPTLAAVDPEFGDQQAPGIGFAIPSAQVRQVADRLIGGEV